jgi:C_GCAxxG_C_C family probable redox protein
MPDKKDNWALEGIGRRELLKLSLAAGAVLLAQGVPVVATGEAAAIPRNRQEHAVSRFRKSLNCSQAVLETYAPSLGMSVKTARRIAAPMAGGMGMGSDCGAVTGAFLVIGLKYGKTRDNDPQADKETFSRVAKFVKEFKAKHTHIGCSALLGTDMGTPEGVKEAEQKGLFLKVCPQLVRSAAEILDKILV